MTNLCSSDDFNKKKKSLLDKNETYGSFNLRVNSKEAIVQSEFRSAWVDWNRKLDPRGKYDLRRKEKEKCCSRTETEWSQTYKLLHDFSLAPFLPGIRGGSWHAAGHIPNVL